MSCKWFVCLLFSSLVYGQASSPSSASRPVRHAPAEAEKTAKVAPTDPVITVPGVCANASKAGDSCETVVTKEQFERLANALQAEMTPDVRRQLAIAYSRMLLMSEEAEKLGFDKEPQYDETLRFARMQILAQRLSRNLQNDAQKVPDEDIEKYYQNNVAAFDEATLLRIFVPKSRQTSKPKSTPAAVKAGTGAAKSGAAEDSEDTVAQEKAAREAMTKVAVSLRARAVNGEDFETLQKSAFIAAGLKASSPPARMDKVRLTTLPAAHQAVLKLKPGEISAVISDPSGHYIYKLVSKQSLSLEAVKTEIRNTLATQRYREAMEKYEVSPDLNQAYFGVPKAASPLLDPDDPD